LVKEDTMGRTLPTATQILLDEEQSFGRFRRALRRSDQLALDDLFNAAKLHTAAAQFASHALPFEVLMLSMLLEEHKEVRRLRERIETLLPIHTNHNTGSGFVDPGFGFDDNPKKEESNE
jgi:carboxylesterase type B